jgi:hypothetical protein
MQEQSCTSAARLYKKNANFPDMRRIHRAKRSVAPPKFHLSNNFESFPHFRRTRTSPLRVKARARCQAARASISTRAPTPQWHRNGASMSLPRLQECHGTRTARRDARRRRASAARMCGSSRARRRRHAAQGHCRRSSNRGKIESRLPGVCPPPKLWSWHRQHERRRAPPSREAPSFTIWRSAGRGQRHQPRTAPALRSIWYGWNSPREPTGT